MFNFSILVVFFTIWEALQGQYEYFLHHLILFGLVFFLIDLPGHMMRYVPQLLILEISQTLLVFAWFGRLFGYGNAPWMGILEGLFVVTFTVLRMFHLPTVLWSLLEKLDGRHLLVGRLLLWPFQALQIYWFGRVLAALAKKLKGGKDSNGDKDNQ